MQFYVGGILASQNGLDVFENFTGCIDNLVVNSVNVGKELKRIYDSKDEYQIKLHSKQNVQFYCQVCLIKWNMLRSLNLKWFLWYE